MYVTDYFNRFCNALFVELNALLSFYVIVEFWSHSAIILDK